MSRQKKEILDPEQEMRRKFKLKCRFRAVARLVQANTHWMAESGADRYAGVDDVKRRVAQAIRGKTKKKQLLNLNDKALLNKPAQERTDQEKQYLYRIIGGLKCFKRYPAHVKRKLAAVTYFKYYAPNRVIVRQHHEARAMYFLVSGGVVISQMVMDDLIHELVRVEVGSMQQGDMFGEVSLLHNIPRTATCTTTGHCELLVLMKEDFKNVLLASVQKQWDEVKKAMDAFTYFDALDEVARREGCIIARMKSYDINETILGDGAGVPNFVYFVLSGRCQMIESLQVIPTTRLGKTTYKLYETYEESEDSECLDFEAKYFGALKTKPSQPSQSKSQTSEHKEPGIEITQVSEKSHSLLKSREGSRSLSAKSPAASGALETVGVQEQEGSKVSVKTEEAPGKEPSVQKAKSLSIASSESSKMASEERLERMPSVGPEPEPSVVIDPTPIEKAATAPSGDGHRSPKRLSVIKEESEMLPLAPTNLKTYFMQVCQMNPGCTFGFGENMKNRRILALTPVDCMLMPKIWLLQKNTANIWSRIEHFLDRKIPTTKQLFREFVNSRNWLEYRERLVREVMARGNTVNWTTEHDVPYSIRIEEELDI